MNSFLSTDNTPPLRPSQMKTSKSHYEFISSILKNTSLSNTMTTIRNFTLIKEIGKGSFGTVYLSLDNTSHQVYAIKAIDKFFLAKQNRTMDALVERALLVSCDNERIVKLHSSFQTKTKLCFVIDYVPNRTLQDFINATFPIDFDLAKYFAFEIAKAIQYLHREKNIVHRDIKPSNILLDEDYGIKVIDFASSIIEDMAFNMKTKRFEHSDENEDDIIGTCEYVSPEMIQRRDMRKKSNDIWSYGCILYQLFHGVTPFKGNCQSETMKNIERGKFTINPNLPLALRQLIERCLCYDNKERICIDDIIEDNFFKGYTVVKSDIIDAIEGYPKNRKYFNILSKDKKSFTTLCECSTLEDEEYLVDKVKISTDEYEIENFYHIHQISNDIIDDYYYTSPSSEITHSGCVTVDPGVFHRKKSCYMVLKKGELICYTNHTEKEELFKLSKVDRSRITMNKDVNNILINLEKNEDRLTKWKKVIVTSTKKEMEKWYKSLEI